ncbi:glycoside hydrolase family 3 protein [Actinomadura xylanilytica]|uniref:glycoside hydrolase family 3 protein n=1 Tax=Actinomadura xylanilytica TaxID=887459 RepID=UPI00255B2CCD|nr:glycoside hydrolase family 3 protein [Actinomadura xylanilytica]MDL4771711.1 glycoside hydrolase family 3 C-terminal domain-containing protein [Actinomadura xylanilytica]
MTIDESGLRARLAELTLDEKTDLLTGADFWTLRPIPRIGLRRLVLSDGPNGVRGTRWDDRETSLLFPNPTALAATWDPAAAERTGRLNGAQARDKGVHVQLAPTLNLHRTPLGGRHFENYSEDPLLVARIGAAFVRGVQSAGVAATAKHVVGNESETERMSYDARIDDRTLDRLYLRPFEEAVRAGAWAAMAAYNGVNGTTMTENRPLLTGVLKERWGFDGVLVSDWTAIRSTEAAANAGMDLEMPGLPTSPWRGRLAAAVREGRVAAELIDDKVLRILRLAARVGALDGFPGPPPATTPADARDQLRELASRGMVLLRNEGGALPLNAPGRIALIGPNAVRFAAQGGGSAHVTPAHVVTPEEGLRQALGDAEIIVRPGVHPHERLAPLPLAMATDPETGEPGVRLEFLGADGAPLRSERRAGARFVLYQDVPDGTREIVARTRVTPAEDGAHTFAASGVGELLLTIGGNTTAITLAPGGGDLVEALMRPPEHRVEVDLAAGRAVPVELRLACAPDRPALALGLGHWAPHLTEDEELAAAVAAARGADAAVVVVGTNDAVESEGFDRTTLALPGRQDELVSAVAAVNPRTVVVVNAGAPVLMPWRDEAAAVLWAWLPGQEGGAAIADVLTGAAEPGGRLPTTFPVTGTGVLSPVPGPDGTLEYSEGTAIGYRHYPPHDVAYPFGHGLGYTTWAYESLAVAGGVAEVTVRNTGGRSGREIVQCYASEEGPPVRLVGFGVAEAGPGGTATVRIGLDGPPAVPYTLRAGSSIADLPLTARV